ncbi:hypothetical protein [uncultured Draconibacterium sp.]|uniref:hypothetical protein n=1 Tax=uncultured Draconibacterium sp. TaxID=1573823 RepID=UPI0025DD8BA4|nr:hypothetical protein [uncultured Draconibacterium sp.]
MKNIILLILLVFCGFSLLAQTTNFTTVNQSGKDQFAETDQVGNMSSILIQQISNKAQFAWVNQSGEIEDHETQMVSQGGEDNHSVVDQTYGGKGNLSYLHQFGSHNNSRQIQKGNGNQFNIIGVAPDDEPGIESEESYVGVPNQDGDYHQLYQIVDGNSNQAWIYQAGRDHFAQQDLQGDLNETWTSQSGNDQYSTMIISGNRNGSHYLQHGEGKFPHDESEEETEHDETDHGKGKSGSSVGKSDDGGKPSEIPPVHDESHVFVPTVGVAIKQMGKGSTAEMIIEGDDNKATITQRGGSGNEGKNCEGGHFAGQEINGDWNRIFADQRGTHHYGSQVVSGLENLVTSIQRGNGSNSTIDLLGDLNEIGCDQKGKSNFSDIDVSGSYNGNFIAAIDEYGVKILQEGRGNYSDLDIAGNFNFVSVQQGGGGSSVIDQSGDWHSATVTQSSLTTH